MNKELEKLFESLKEYEKKELGLEDNEINASEILKNVKDIEKDRTTNGYIYISQNGMSAEGNIPDVMSLLSILVMKLKENGLAEELIKKSVEIELADKEGKEKMLKDNLERFIKMLNEKGE